MKRLLLALAAVICAASGVANAQTYKTLYGTSLYLSGGGAPVVPLILKSPTLGSTWTHLFDFNVDEDLTSRIWFNPVNPGIGVSLQW